MKTVTSSWWSVALAATCGGFMLPDVGLAAETPQSGSLPRPSIKILVLPPSDLKPGGDKTDELRGAVSGLTDVEGYRVVIYSKGTNTWWVQPIEANPLTKIGVDGEFSADIYSGTDYAVLLVKDSYKPAPILGQLPEVGNGVLALERKEPGEALLSSPAELRKKGTANRQSIEMLRVPRIPPGVGTAEINGVVSGLASIKDHRVVLYSKDDRDTWWIQPSADKPLTKIGVNGQFSADIHGGTCYAALLVKDGYKPAATCQQLPEVRGDVMAKDRKKPGK